jgi:hypothetical protein
MTRSFLIAALALLRKKTANPLDIPAQRFDGAEQQKFCENMSMNPWHAVPEQRPLGGINRVRKIGYETISKLRRDLNGAPRSEPTGDETFPD